MLFLKLFFLAYLVAAILASIMAFVAIDSKAFRLVFIVLGAVTPAMFLYALVATFVAPKPVPFFQEEIANVEDDIENERVRIFGGQKTSPSFSKRWQIMYEAHLEKIAINAVHTSEKIVSIVRRNLRPTRIAA